MRGTDISLPDLVGRLADEGKAVVTAEIGLARAKLRARIDAAKMGVVLLAMAAVLALLAAIALVIGIVLVLLPLVGPVVATALVVIVLLIVAAALGWLGVRQLSTKPQPIADAGR